MGLKPELHHLCGVLYDVYDIDLGQRSPGSACIGLYPSCGEPKWPSVAMELSRDCALTVMEEKAKWWFTASEGAVKIVLLVKLDKNLNEVLVQRLSGPSFTLLSRYVLGLGGTAIRLGQQMRIRLILKDPAAYRRTTAQSVSMRSRSWSSYLVVGCRAVPSSWSYG